MNTNNNTELPGLKIRLHMAGIILLFISACTLFKERSIFRTDSLMKQSGRLDLNQDLNFSSGSIRISNYTDSSSVDFYTEIFPQGSFSYSPISGFIGHADLIRVNGKAEIRQQGLDSSNKVSKLTLNSTLNEQYKNKQTGIKKEKVLKKEMPHWLWLGVIVILLGLVAVYRKGKYGEFLSFFTYGLIFLELFSGIDTFRT